MDVPVVTDRRRGAIGVDLNADHPRRRGDRRQRELRERLAGAVSDLRQEHSTRPRLIIGDAVASVVEYAREVGKPIVIEKLDFRQKKAVSGGTVS